MLHTLMVIEYWHMPRNTYNQIDMTRMVLLHSLQMKNHVEQRQFWLHSQQAVRVMSVRLNRGCDLRRWALVSKWKGLDCRRVFCCYGSGVMHVQSLILPTSRMRSRWTTLAINDTECTGSIRSGLCWNYWGECGRWQQISIFQIEPNNFLAENWELV